VSRFHFVTDGEVPTQRGRVKLFLGGVGLLVAAAVIASIASACGTNAQSGADGGAHAGSTSSGAGGSGGAGSGSSGGVGASDASVGSPSTDATLGDQTPGDDGAATTFGASDAGAEGGSDSASSCASTITGAQSTSGLAGWQGDWIPGDYPSGDAAVYAVGDAAADTYLTISNVQGQQGLVRQYRVHVPPGYSSGTAMPVLFCLHGLDQTAVSFCTDEGVAWPAKADAEGFIVVMPNGYQYSWNGGACCGKAASMDLDDVALMRAIFAEVGTHVNLDLRRVYATGFSTGGFLSYRLACQASDLFTAVAAAAGGVGTNAVWSGTNTKSDLATCAPTNKVSVLDVHGTKDPLVPFAVQAESLKIISSSNGCSSSTMPALVPPSGGDTTCVTYEGCPTCPKVEVTGCAVDGGGHCWFGSTDCGTGGGAIGKAVVGNGSNFMKDTDQIWAFFSRLAH
jgi:polyhydroxybutyrate depolymerase